jgi:hypothetical protein
MCSVSSLRVLAHCRRYPVPSIVRTSVLTSHCCRTQVSLARTVRLSVLLLKFLHFRIHWQCLALICPESHFGPNVYCWHLYHPFWSLPLLASLSLANASFAVDSRCDTPHHFAASVLQASTARLDIHCPHSAHVPVDSDAVAPPPITTRPFARSPFARYYSRHFSPSTTRSALHAID